MAKKAQAADSSKQQKAGAKKGNKQQTPEREVIYDKPSVNVCIGDKALTAEVAKQLLGWREVESDFYHLKDYEKNRVWLEHNARNRPFDEDWSRSIAQDILQHHWQFNMENIIVGRTGLVLSGQHRLVGLILASQMWAAQPHWKDKWDKEPSIDVTIALGASEEPHVVRTFDNVKPRSPADVFFTDEKLFATFAPKDRKELCQIMDKAVRTLWYRTGAHNNAWTPHRTNSESVDFVERHKRLPLAVKHLWEDSKAGKLAKYLSTLGYASALLYLMGASASDGVKYRAADELSEKKINFANWDKALEFWTLLASDSPTMKAVKEARRPLAQGEWDGYIFVRRGTGQDRDTVNGGTIHERLACLCKAWSRFVNGQKIRAEDLLTEEDYKIKEDGAQLFVSFYDVSGIDLGDTVSQRSKDKEQDELEEEGSEPSEEEIEARKKAEQERKREALLANRSARKVSDSNPNPDAGPSNWEAGEAENGQGPRKPPAPKINPPRPKAQTAAVGTTDN